MYDTSNLTYFAPADKLVDILCQKTQNNNRLFFHVLVAYYFAKVASMMRCNIKTHDRGVIPVNLYAINLAASGEGKGHSLNIVEDQLIDQFKEYFLTETFPNYAQLSIEKIALYRSAKQLSSTYDKVLEKAQKEFELLGALAFSFDSGTTAAVKQMRHKLLMASAGSMNMEIDEIGSNLLGNVDVLTSFLELYDIGKIKQKLVKNTAENIRNEEIPGRTPTNMMLFGTPAKLLNGGRVEDEFYSMLETGYARRCLFGFSKDSNKNSNLTAAEVYNMLTDADSDAYLKKMSDNLLSLADTNNFGVALNMDKSVSIQLIEYRLSCEKIANTYAEHEEVKKAEMCHRYFKALKLAGAYAFISGASHVDEKLLSHAICLVEASGEAFHSLLSRERNYVKLARYVASVGHEVTYADLVEDLPFYKGTESQKREMMSLAIAYGYKNNIIIKKSIHDNIEFLEGESLTETNLNKLILSYSTNITTGYTNHRVKITDLHKLTQSMGHHWVAHHLIDGYRREDNVLAGSNIVVLDVDDGTSIDSIRMLLKDYAYHIYTTKRHTPEKNRCRILLFMSHELVLNKLDYKEFMKNIYEWLPFGVDTQTNDRSRKWLANTGTYWENDGKLLDVLPFIPKTSKNTARKQIVDSLQGLSNIERWFVDSTNTGNRSNQLIKYALLLVDMGHTIEDVQSKVSILNNKFDNNLTDAEINSTIMVTASKAILKRDTTS